MCAAVLVFSVPDSASAGHCDYCNDGLPTEVRVAPEVLSADGVLLLSLIDDRGRQLEQTWWDGITVTVLDAEGQSVTGAIEVLEHLTPAVWRPAEPWAAGSYRVEVHVELGGDCSPYDRSFEVTVNDAETTPAMPEVVFTETYSSTSRMSLNNLVCCDDAAPYDENLPGIICPGYPSSEVRYFDGYCTTVDARGWVQLDATLPDKTPARFTLHERTWARRPVGDSRTVAVELEEAACLEFEVVDMVTGDTTVHPYCFEPSGELLGTFQRPEVLTELAEACEGRSYRCEGSWHEPDTCPTWPESSEPEPADPSCACHSTNPPPLVGGLFLLLLGGTRRRPAL